MIANIIWIIIHDSFVWITKYRKKVLSGIVAERVGELVRDICKEHEVEIWKGHVSKDHVHLFVSVPPHLAKSKVVQYSERQEVIQIVVRK